MSIFLPLFPLQLVVYPDEQLNLHIFEPRYKQLIQECEEEGITFGIPAYINGAVKEVGTEIELVNVEKRYTNGELDVKTKGLGLFRIEEFFKVAPDKLYAGAYVERLDVEFSGDYLLNESILKMTKELFEMLNITKELPENSEDFQTYQVAHHVGLNLEQEYEFLRLIREKERQEYLLNHLERMLPIVREMQNLREKVKMNGHFKNILPPKL